MPADEGVPERCPTDPRPREPELAGEGIEMHDRRLATQHHRTAIIHLEPLAAAADGGLIEQDLARAGQ